MKDIRITENHPIKKRYILGPLGRVILKLINWDIVGNLPDNKKIIIASAPHSSSFDSIYAFFVCMASDLKFYFLGSISMFTQQVIDELRTKDKFILYLTVEGLMHTNKTIKSGFYYIGKELDASIVPTKIDYKNRRFELMEEYNLTDSLENDKNALMNVYHMVEGRNKTFYKPESK